jgi:hypothetical protein
MEPLRTRPVLLALVATAALAACGGGGDGGSSPPPAPEETRVQDSRKSYVPAEPNATTFAALAPAAGDTVAPSSTSRWAGVLGGAAYRIEVPQNWNGKLVMYAHGYAGTGNTLVVNNPQIRRYLIANATPGPHRATPRTTTTCGPASRTPTPWRWPSPGSRSTTAGR